MSMLLLPNRGEILRAREQIGITIRFLRGGRDDELHLIEADLGFEMGALHAIEWVLGLPGGEWFQRHLKGLKQIEPELIIGARNDDPGNDSPIAPGGKRRAPESA